MSRRRNAGAIEKRSVSRYADRMDRRSILLTTGLLAMISLSGCLERRIFITSDPPGALVHLNDVEVGRTPVDVDFTHYGVYDVRLTKDGFAPLLTSREAKAPVYEWPFIDLVAEAVPTRTVTEFRWHFALESVSSDPDDVIERGRALREQVGASLDAEAAGEELMGPPIPIISDDEPLPEPEYRELMPEPLPEDT